jgi:hypothetical protein
MKGKREMTEQTEITECTERFMVSIFRLFRFLS